MEEADLRILAAQRAIVELSAAVGGASRAKVLGNLEAELETAVGDECLVILEAAQMIRDGHLLELAEKLGRLA